MFSTLLPPHVHVHSEAQQMSAFFPRPWMPVQVAREDEPATVYVRHGPNKIEHKKVDEAGS